MRAGAIPDRDWWRIGAFWLPIIDGLVKSRFRSLREHFGRTSDVQLKC